MAHQGNIGLPWPHLVVVSLLCIFCVAGAPPNHPWSEHFTREAERPVSPRQANATDTEGLFRKQFTNPSEIMNVMLLIGGDVIQKAILQMAGFSHVTPVVFSFGWVTYSFNSMANGGKGLPNPDYSTTVMPVIQGLLPIQNQSFLLGRLVRDLERRTQDELSKSRKFGGEMVVSVFEIDPTPRPGKDQYGPLKPCKDLIWWSFLPFLVAQLIVASVPIILNKNWSIILITASGNALALAGASLPTIRHNKYACGLGSPAPYILTSGAGSKYAFLILPDTLPQDILLVSGLQELNKLPRLDELAYGYTKSQTSYWYSVCLCLLWVVLLIAVGGLEEDTWYLFAVGALGMVHSVLVASMPRKPESHGIPLKRTRGAVFRFGTEHALILQTLQQLEEEYPGVGHALMSAVFSNFSDMPTSLFFESANVSESTIEERTKKWIQQFYHTGRERDGEVHGNGGSTATAQVQTRQPGKRWCGMSPW